MLRMPPRPLSVRELWAVATSDRAGLRTYPGLPHRMERIPEKDGVLFVNDSKATNPTATAPALAASIRDSLDCGGLAKTDDLDACAPSSRSCRARPIPSARRAIVRFALVAAHGCGTVRNARTGGGRSGGGGEAGRHGVAVAGLRQRSTSFAISRRAATSSARLVGAL